LQYFPRFRDFEPEFDGIKRFLDSGEADKQRVTPILDQFVFNLRQGTLKEWAHLLTAQADEHCIEARMRQSGGPYIPVSRPTGTFDRELIAVLTS
jgi:hypothetical protein